jgi:hypothetical protein
MIGRSPAKGGRGATLYPGRSTRGRGGRGMPGGRRQAGALVTNPGPMAQYNVAPGKAQLTARFMAEGLRQQLQHHSYLVQAQWPGQAAGGPALPDHVQHFHTLYPLEDMLGADERISPALGIKSLVVKAINAHDGLAYALRRVDGKQVRHPPLHLCTLHCTSGQHTAIHLVDMCSPAAAQAMRRLAVATHATRACWHHTGDHNCELLCAEHVPCTATWCAGDPHR